MSRIVGNPARTALYAADVPDGPLTPRQRAIADAVRHCGALADFCWQREVERTTIIVAEVRRTTPPEVAEQQVREGIARARRKLDELEGLLRAYGAAAFTPKVEQMPAVQGATRHEIVVKAMQAASARGAVLVRAGDRELTRAADGGYVLVDEPDPADAALEAAAADYALNGRERAMTNGAEMERKFAEEEDRKHGFD